MASGSPFTINFLYVGVLLVPGYISLRGYLQATVQLDTVSRFDKLLLTVVGGAITLSFTLLANRIGIPQFVVAWFPPMWTETTVWEAFELLGPRSSRAITLDGVPSLSALTLLFAVAGQSLVGYVLGYGLGTTVHVVLNDREKSREDLEQPWETAVRQSALGDEVTVVTHTDEHIRGRLYRIGSPSAEYDLLLANAERVYVDGSTESLGMTYHHYRDIARVQFPRMRPERTGSEANALVRLWDGPREGPPPNQ